MEEEKFIVRQSVFFNFLVGLILLVIFICVMFTIRGSSSFSDADVIIYLALFLIPAIAFFKNGINKKVLFQIDASGIYYCNNLITNWGNFVQAYFLEDETKNIRDFNVKFSLYIEYYNTETSQNNLMTIPLAATLDKSCEEIMAAIENFSHPQNIDITPSLN